MVKQRTHISSTSQQNGHDELLSINFYRYVKTAVAIKLSFKMEGDGPQPMSLGQATYRF